VHMCLGLLRSAVSVANSGSEQDDRYGIRYCLYSGLYNPDAGNINQTEKH